MRQLQLPSLSRTSAIIVVSMVLLFYSGFAFDASPVGFYSVKGWMWIMLFAGLTVLTNLSILHQRLAITPILVWAYCLLAMMLLWSVILPNPLDAQAPIIAFGWYMIVVAIALILFRTEAARMLAIRAVFLIVIGSAITNLVMAAQGAFRPAGLYGNPNTSGYALVMGTIVTHSFIPPKFRFLYQIFILAGVFVTASRASLVLWAVSVILLYVLDSKKRNYNRWAIFSMVILFGVAISPLGSGFLDTLDDPENETARLFSLGSKEELEDDSRYDLAELALNEVEEHPILGQGTGVSTVFYDNMDYGTHNMYLTLMMQFGILGIVVIPALAAVILGRPSARWQFAVPFAVFLIIAAFFSHTILSQWHYALMIALLARMTGTEFATAPAKIRTEIATAPNYALA
jgi:O-antigen ligase